MINQESFLKSCDELLLPDVKLVNSGSSNLRVSYKDFNQTSQKIAAVAHHYQDSKYVQVTQVGDKGIYYRFTQVLSNGDICLKTADCSNAAIAAYIYTHSLYEKSLTEKTQLINANNKTTWLIRINSQHDFNFCLQLEKLLRPEDTTTAPCSLHSLDKLSNSCINVLLKSYNEVFHIAVTSEEELYTLIPVAKEISIVNMGIKVFLSFWYKNKIKSVLFYNGVSHRTIPMSTLCTVLNYKYLNKKLTMGAYNIINIVTNHTINFSLFKNNTGIQFSTQVGAKIKDLL